METSVKELSIEERIKAIDEEYYKHRNRASTKLEMDSGDVSALFAFVRDEITWMAEKLNKHLPRKYETFGAQKYCPVEYAVRKFSELVSFRVNNDELAEAIRWQINSGTDIDFPYFKNIILWHILCVGYDVIRNKRGRWINQSITLSNVMRGD